MVFLVDEDLPEPPPFMKDALRSPPSDEGRLNRAPGAFGDRNGRFKKPQPKVSIPVENREYKLGCFQICYMF